MIKTWEAIPQSKVPNRIAPHSQRRRGQKDVQGKGNARGFMHLVGDHYNSDSMS